MIAQTKAFVLAGLFFSVILFPASQAGAHCEIPCGIYDDLMRIKLIAEDATTIEKSMNMIKDLSAQQPVNYNQLVRWVVNKEEHANKIQHTVYQYFMTQRIKPDTKDYEKKVVVLHKMLVTAMQCKQTTDLSHVETLRSLLKQFEKLYFGHTHE
jgi:nickel superoxide dismutase